MTGFLLFFARIPVLVLALVTGVGAIGSSALTVQAYTAAQETSQSQYAAAESEILARIDASVKQQAALELAIANAKALLDSSSGKTLDDTARAALNAAITDAQLQLQQATAQVAAAQANLQQHQAEMAGFVLPWTVAAVAQDISSAPVPTDNELALIVSGIGDKMKAVNDAQVAWQAEQDRVAAEAAAKAAVARAAAARAAAAKAAAEAAGVSGATTPSAPTQPRFSLTTIAGFNANTYLASLAPNAQVIWQANVCELVLQRVVYLCGFTTTPAIAPGTNNVRIYLDSTFTDRYATREIGLPVLVHEAAHARQYAKYGAAMLKVQSTVPSWVFNIDGDEHAPIEFMAECATIAKLGYGTGTYIGPAQGNYAVTCTAEQLAEGALLWQ